MKNITVRLLDYKGTESKSLIVIHTLHLYTEIHIEHLSFS